MTRIREEDYAYATARVRAVEPRLLDSQRFDRLLEAPTVSDALKLLAEARYAEGTDVSELDWEALLEIEGARVTAFLASVMPYPEVLDVFRLQTDYLQAKRLLKALYQGRDPGALVGLPGTVPLSALVHAIADHKPYELPAPLAEAIFAAMETYGKSADPRDIDLVLDQGAYRHMAESAAAVGHPFLTETVALYTDMANIRIFVRGRLIGESAEFFRKALLPGGTMEPKRFLDAADKSVEAFLESIRFTTFGETAIAGYEAYKAGRGISLFEQRLEDRFMRHVRKAKYVAMGLEPMIGYLIAKETEIRNVRILLTGKVNGLPQEEIREKLRMTYV